VRLVIDAAGLVAHPGAVEAAERGVRTGGDARNRDYVAGHLLSSGSPVAEALVLDPQTSGGLLAAVTPAVAATLVDAGFWTVGSIEAGEPAVVLR
jgi:selenide,water dikinase